MSTTRIVICRHGNTFDTGDTITRVGARTDLALSASGKIQAKSLSYTLSQENSVFNFSEAYCSSLKRTQQTCDEILCNGHMATVGTPLTFLNEIDYGPDENMPESDVINRIGSDALRLWDTRAIVPDGWLVNPSKITQSWRDLFLTSGRSAQDILIVSSNGIIRFLLNAVDDIHCDISSIKMRTAAFGIVEISNNNISLVSWNCRQLAKKHLLTP